MGFTVVHEGGTKDSDYREYVDLLSRLLLKRGVSLDRVPLAPQNGAGDRRLYVWDSEAEARAFAGGSRLINMPTSGRSSAEDGHTRAVSSRNLQCFWGISLAEARKPVGTRLAGFRPTGLGTCRFPVGKRLSPASHPSPSADGLLARVQTQRSAPQGAVDTRRTSAQSRQVHTRSVPSAGARSVLSA